MIGSRRFALPLPHRYELALLWPRLAGAGLTLFGGGFSALPVLKTLFVTPAVGVTNNDFTLAFSLSPLSPGPLSFASFGPTPTTAGRRATTPMTIPWC